MNAWAKSLDPENASGIRFLGDAGGSFSRAFGTEFEAAPFLGTNRSKRFAVEVKDGKVTSVNIEPDNTGISGKSASHLARARADVDGRL
jgi:2-Cys peroxiredoxin 5